MTDKPNQPNDELVTKIQKSLEAATSGLLEEREQFKFGASPLEPMIKLQMELEQVKAECERRHGYWHDELCKNESLRTELEAKDKEIDDLKKELGRND